MTVDGPLHHKFDVIRTDNADADPRSRHFGGCDYFVLDLDHDPYAMAALRSYADACRATHPRLASDLDEWVARKLGDDQ